MKSQSFITTIIFLLFFLLGCEKDTADPVASFTISNSIVEIGEIVSFENLSENSTDYFWDFGDENASAEINPTHIYENLGRFTVSLSAYGNTTKNTSTKTIEIVPPPANIEPGVRAGDFYLNDDLSTHLDKLDVNQLDYHSFQLTDGDYAHLFSFDNIGIEFYLNSPTDDYTLDDVPSRIMVYPPFDGWAMGGITFGSSFVDVVNEFGAPLPIPGDHFYDGVIFWADPSGLNVDGISIQ